MSTSIKEYIDVVIVVSALSTSFVGGVGGFLLRFECLITSLTPATALHARGVGVFMGSLWTNQQLSMEVKIWRGSGRFNLMARLCCLTQLGMLLMGVCKVVISP